VVVVSSCVVVSCVKVSLVLASERASGARTGLVVEEGVGKATWIKESRSCLVRSSGPWCRVETLLDSARAARKTGGARG